MSRKEALALATAPHPRFGQAVRTTFCIARRESSGLIRVQAKNGELALSRLLFATRKPYKCTRL